jgi:hypothetical protein
MCATVKRWINGLEIDGRDVKCDAFCWMWAYNSFWVLWSLRLFLERQRGSCGVGRTLGTYESPSVASPLLLLTDGRASNLRAGVVAVGGPDFEYTALLGALLGALGALLEDDMPAAWAVCWNKH